MQVEAEMAAFDGAAPAAFDSSKLLENFLNVSFKYFPSNCFYLTSQGPVREAMLDGLEDMMLSAYVQPEVGEIRRQVKA